MNGTKSSAWHGECLDSLSSPRDAASTGTIYALTRKPPHANATLRRLRMEAWLKRRSHTLCSVPEGYAHRVSADACMYLSFAAQSIMSRWLSQQPAIVPVQVLCVVHATHTHVSA